MAKVSLKENAVLGDEDLQAALKSINPKWGEMCIKAAGEVWGMPLISQKTKALITIAVDVVNNNETGTGTPFEAHVDMALKQGATRAELDELLLFMTVYAGYNKVAGAFGALDRIEEKGKTGFGTKI
ncbi:MAG: carboxymuconolactone decarboxylase family protein [Nitrospirae bacterium]|nr:carboxymuconolactone decarboxylase family protein [Nitrospirota bacterium]